MSQLVDCIRSGQHHIREIEREYARRLGRQRFDQLAGLLGDLAPREP